MGVGHPAFGTFCCICFGLLTPDTCAVDVDGVRWDVCPGICAVQAGIQEQVKILPEPLAPDVGVGDT